MHNRDVFFKRIVTIVLFLFVQTLENTTHLFFPFFFTWTLENEISHSSFIHLTFVLFLSTSAVTLTLMIISKVATPIMRCSLSDNDTSPSKMAFFFFCKKTLLELSLTWGLDRIINGFCWGYHFAHILKIAQFEEMLYLMRWWRPHLRKSGKSSPW